jgi:hypothetical protein
VSVEEELLGSATLVLGRSGTIAAREVQEESRGSGAMSRVRQCIGLRRAQLALLVRRRDARLRGELDRKSTRLNSSHRLTSRMPSSA